MTSVCIDAGTTVIKAVGYDDAVREHVVAKRPTTVCRPAPGHAEQDMDEVWRAVGRGRTRGRRRPARPRRTWWRSPRRATGPGWSTARAADRAGHAVERRPRRRPGRRWERDGVAEDGPPQTGSPTFDGHAQRDAVLAAQPRPRPPRALRHPAHLRGLDLPPAHRRAGRGRARTPPPRSSTCAGAPVRRPARALRHGVGRAAAARAGRRRPAGRAARRRGGRDSACRRRHAGRARAVRPVHDRHRRRSRRARPTPAASSAPRCRTEIVLGELDGDLGGLAVPLGVEGRWLQAFPTMAGGDVLVWWPACSAYDDVGGLLELAAGADGPGAVGRSCPTSRPPVSGPRSPTRRPVAR